MNGPQQIVLDRYSVLGFFPNQVSCLWKNNRQDEGKGHYGKVLDDTQKTYARYPTQNNGNKNNKKVVEFWKDRIDLVHEE